MPGLEKEEHHGDKEESNKMEEVDWASLAWLSISIYLINY